MKKENKEIFEKELLSESQKTKLSNYFLIYLLLIVLTYFLKDKYFHELLLKIGFVVIGALSIVFFIILVLYSYELNKKKKED